MLKITMADTTYLKCGSGPISFLISGYFSEDVQGREGGREGGREEGRNGRGEGRGEKRDTISTLLLEVDDIYTPKTTYY